MNKFDRLLVIGDIHGKWENSGQSMIRSVLIRR